jgi:NAD-reducing hydrogenase small subunit
MSRPKLASIWLDGCSGCHMSLLDTDERLLQLTAQADLVYSPLVDNKVYPDDVDIVLVEGAVSTNEDLERIEMVRKRSKILVSFGDCAITTNVPGMRNTFGGTCGEAIYQRAYVDNITILPGRPQPLPSNNLPTHLPKTLAVHRVVDVDVFLPGCPPSADLIFETLSALLEGRTPAIASARFGK